MEKQRDKDFSVTTGARLCLQLSEALHGGFVAKLHDQH